MTGALLPSCLYILSSTACLGKSNLAVGFALPSVDEMFAMKSNRQDPGRLDEFYFYRERIGFYYRLLSHYPDPLNASVRITIK